MNENRKLEYWHWFHGLNGIRPDEKEELLKIQKDPEEWFLAGKRNETEEIFEAFLSENCVKTERWLRVKEILGSEAERVRLQKSFDMVIKKNIRIVKL